MAAVASNLVPLGSMAEALDLALRAIVAATTRSYNSVATDDPTLTVAQFVNSITNVSGQTTTQAVTTPTATAIVAAIPNCQIGSFFEFVLQNAQTLSGAVTLTAGAGVTISSGSAVPITKTQIYRGIVTAIDTPTVLVYGLLTAPV